MPSPPKIDPVKTCAPSGRVFTRRRFGNRLEDRSRFLSRRHCSQGCANTKPVVSKDANHWRARKHKATCCSECATTKRLHVHHKDRNPANNRPANLQTLCASCHLKLHWREDRESRLAAARRGV